VSLIEHQAAAVRAGYAAGLGVDPEAFLSHSLVLADRVEPATWPYVVLAVDFGTGTVVSLDPDYRAFVEANLPEHHYAATTPDFLNPIQAEAARRGRTVSVGVTANVFALGSVPEMPELPAGLRFEVVELPWMRAEMELGRFENGVGRLSRNGREFRNKYGVAIFEGDEPVAVGGVFDTWGTHEIGVDVLRSHRGKALGQAVVARAVLEILERGGTPLYGCAPTNIRSMRTALSAGFLPVCADAGVS